MKPIRLGVIFDQSIQSGGGYQQALNSALLAHDLPNDLVEVVFFSTLEENLDTLAKHHINSIHMQLNVFHKTVMYLRRRIRDPRVLKLVKLIGKYNPFERILINHGIDLVCFIAPSGLPRDLEKLNYIMTVWDMCHRDDVEFPEVRWDRELEIRDVNYRSVLPRATAILVDSELSRANIIHRYGLDSERVYALPFQSAVSVRHHLDSEVDSSIDVRNKFQLDMPYVFYPAQFWAHKNHVYILEGLRLLEQNYGIRIGAIFSGGDQGNLHYIEKQVQELGLNDRVRFAGFVENEVMADLYRQSLALVMPTYFGPTNLPPLEAFELGVPVLYSDKKGLRDQVGDAGLLMDLTNPNSMALHLKNLIENDELRERLVVAGYDRIKYFDSSNRVDILRMIIENYRWRRMCWK